MKLIKLPYFSVDKIFALFVFIQNVFNKPKGTNSSAVPLSQGQVVVSPPSGSAVSAGGGNTSAVSPSSVSGSAAANLQPPSAQSQRVALTHTVVKLKCQHCNHLFATKPELLFYKVKRDRGGDWIWVYLKKYFCLFIFDSPLVCFEMRKKRIS